MTMHCSLWRMRQRVCTIFWNDNLRNAVKHNWFNLCAESKDNDDDADAVTRSVAIQQIMDSVHFAVRHRERVDVDEIAKRVASKVDDQHTDFQTLCHDELTAEIDRVLSARKYSGWRRERAKQHKYNKFTTSNTYAATRSVDAEDDWIEDVAPQCLLDEVICDLESFGVEQSVIDTLRELLIVECHDTDSFLDDVDGVEPADSVFGAILRQSAKGGLLEALSDRIFEYRAVNEQYSSSVRFFYWKFYKDNKAESNILFKTDRGQPLIEQNPGYKLMDWFVPPKYVDFKTEITSNPLSGLSQRDWNETLEKATVRLTAYNKDSNRRPLVCGMYRDLKGNNRYVNTPNKWHKPYGIKKGDKVTIFHIMSLLFYTNYSVASYEFSASFRRRFYNETDGALKRRHSAFAHQSRLLRELVEVFGNRMKYCSVSTFYHGISADLIFEGTSFKLSGPMSTTSGLSSYLICSNLVHIRRRHIFSKKKLSTFD